jgi:hypothetical protein
MNTITANELKTHLYIVAADGMEGRETGSAGQRAGTYLINQYKKMIFLFPKAVSSFNKKVPAAFLNAKRNENLPDSENIWAFIEGSEKPNEILASAHYDHVSKKMVMSIMALMTMAQEQLHYLKLLRSIPKRRSWSKTFHYVFACNSEEHGLLGSSYYSENLYPYGEYHYRYQYRYDRSSRRGTC